MPPDPEYLTIGRIAAPRGLRGEVKVEILTDFPDRFSLLDRVYLGPGHTLYELEGFRRDRKWALLKFRGYDTRDSVEHMRSLLVGIPASEAMPLGPDEYYEHQIVGLQVWTEDEQFLGRLDAILFTGGNDVYVVKGAGKEILIPVIQDVVREIDLDAGRILVRLMEGLI